MTKLTLGPGCRCDLASLVDTRLLVQANSGGGKSWLLRRLLEQSQGHVQQIVIDPEGEFATLREKYDYVYAARHGGDTAAEPRAAKLLAERLLELGVSAILDIYELKAHDRVRFVRYFLEAMVDAPKRLWHPVLVVVDESHVYCPQRGDAESAAAVIDLCTRGRKRGFCAVLATQRLSKLHKDAAAELNNKLIGRTGLDVDVKRATEELGFTNREDQVALRRLDPGDFFAFGPALSQEVSRVHIGPVQTTHPKAGARIAFTPPPPTAKVKALLPKLADLPAEAEERARSLAELQRELRERDRQIRALERTAPATQTEVKRVEVPVLKAAQITKLDRLAARLDTMAGRLFGAAEQLVPVATEFRQNARELGVALEQVRNGGQSGRTLPAVQASGPRVARVATRGPRPVAQVALPSIEGVSGSQQRILNALAWLEEIGVRPAEKTQVALLANQSPTSGGYHNNLGRLRTGGLIEYPAAGQVALTDAGRAAAAPVDVPTSSEELHEQICARLSGSQVRILRTLIACYPEPMSKDDLAAAADQSPTSGGYHNNLGRLRTLGLIDYPTPGKAVAQPVLFLEGRR